MDKISPTQPRVNHPDSDANSSEKTAGATELSHQSSNTPSLKSRIKTKSRAFEDADAHRIAVDPHNFKFNIEAKTADSADLRRQSAEALFDSSIAAQKNRVLEFNAAKLINSSPLAKTYLLNFGKSLVEILRQCYSSNEIKQKENDMFRFYRANQAGAVGVDDNVFLKLRKKHTLSDSDITLRELGASLAQTVAIGENKEFLLMLRKISDDAQLQDQLKNYVDIDFFRRLCIECGCDEKGLPKTDAYRVKLYTENNDLQVRTKTPDNYQVKAYPTSTLQLSPREASFIEFQEVANRATGGQIFRITPDSSFAKRAIELARPTTSGPSGTTFHIVLAAKLLAPVLKSKFGLAGEQLEGSLGWKSYSAKLLMMTLMGYLHGEREADHHHSMEEVIQGGQHADKLIRSCYIGQSEKAEDETFGYDQYSIESLMTEIFRTFHQDTLL